MFIKFLPYSVTFSAWVLWMLTSHTEKQNYLGMLVFDESTYEKSLLLLPTSECFYWSLTRGWTALPPNYHLMEESNNGYSKI